MIPVIPTQTQWVIRGFVGLAIAAAAFAAGWAVNGWRLESSYQAQEAERSRAQLQQLERQAEKHARDQATMQEIVHAQLTESTRNAGSLAAARRDADGLRDRLGGALRVGSGVSDSLAACQQRAEAAGRLLGDGLRVQAELAGAAESLATDVRALRGHGQLNEAP